MTEITKELGCNYQGFAFGAHYPDGACIDGYLWDLDACDEDGNLYLGGDIPCPECNHEAWVEACVDSIEDAGFVAYEDGLMEEDCPFFEGCKIEYPDDWRIFKEHWLIGYRSAKKEDTEVTNDRVGKTV